MVANIPLQDGTTFRPDSFPTKHITVAKLEALAESLPHVWDGSEGAYEKDRVAAVEATRRLLAQLQTPYERSVSLALEAPTCWAALKTVGDLGIWKEWASPKHSRSRETKSLEEIRGMASSEIDAALLSRLLRLLVAHCVIQETGDDFCSTSFSLSLGKSESEIATMLDMSYLRRSKSLYELPAFLQETGYREPRGSSVTNFASCNAGSEQLHKDITLMTRSRSTVSGEEKGTAPWPNWYDIQGRLIDGADLEGGPLLVDMGGRLGMDITHVARAFPDLPQGSLVLQDRPEATLQTTLSDGRITLIPHGASDAPQPASCQKARAYFLHNVLHTLTEERASSILQELRLAMRPEYSRLLICDIVLPHRNATVMQATMDMLMMNNHGTRERTLEQWTQLLEANGFVLIKVWKDGQVIESILEAEIARHIL